MAHSTRPDDIRHAAVRRTRISSAWVATIIAALVLVLLLVFVIQNSQRVSVSFLGAHGWR